MTLENLVDARERLGRLGRSWWGRSPPYRVQGAVSTVVMAFARSGTKLPDGCHREGTPVT